MRVTALIVILLAVVLLATFSSPTGAASGSRRRGRATAHPGWVIAAVVVGVVLLRFGVHWIAVAGGVALATLRSVAPLLRFWPLIAGLKASGGAGRASRSGAGAGGAPPRTAPMTREEALRVLGLEEGATPEDVQREYRRLMRKVHPDLGGSGYLAAKLNEAKDVLS